VLPVLQRDRAFAGSAAEANKATGGDGNLFAPA
jgi:hypothetical protein